MYVERLYDLFMKHDCTMIEINQMAEGTDGQGKTQWSGGGVRHSGQGGKKQWSAGKTQWSGVGGGGVRHSGQGDNNNKAIRDGRPSLAIMLL